MNISYLFLDIIFYNIALIVYVLNLL